MTTRKPKAITIDYNKGKLYTIRSPHTEKVYIGATTQTLSQRMTQHRNSFKKWTNGKYCYVSSFEIFQAGNAYIELLRECPCENKEQLAKYEGEAIRDTANCCNKIIAGRTKKEYYEANRDRILQQQAEYKEANKDKIKEYYEQNKDKIKEYYEANRDRILQQQAEYKEANRDRILQQKKEYREQNRDKILQRAKEYREANRDRINQRRRERRQQKKQQITNELTPPQPYNPHTTFFSEPIFFSLVQTQ